LFDVIPKDANSRSSALDKFGLEECLDLCIGELSRKSLSLDMVVEFHELLFFFLHLTQLEEVRDPEKIEAQSREESVVREFDSTVRIPRG